LLKMWQDPTQPTPKVNLLYIKKCTALSVPIAMFVLYLGVKLGDFNTNSGAF